MGEIGDEVIRGHGFRRGGQCRVDVADRFIFANLAVDKQGQIALLLIQRVVRGVVPFIPADCNLRQGGARLPVMFGHRDDGCGGCAGGRQGVDALDTLASLDLGIVEGFQRASENGTLVDRGVQHAGDANIQTELRAAIGLGRDIETGLRFAQQGELRGILRLCVPRNGELRGLERQFAEACALAARRVDDDASFNRAFGSRHAELFCGRLDEHGACRGARVTHRGPRIAHAGGPAGGLHAQQFAKFVLRIAHHACHPAVVVRARRNAVADHGGVRVNRIDRSLLEAHLRGVGIQLLGYQHRECRGNALSHLLAGHLNHHAAVRADPDPSRQQRVIRARPQVGGWGELVTLAIEAPGADGESAAGDRCGLPSLESPSMVVIFRFAQADSGIMQASYCPAVEMHGTGAARGDAATEFRSGQIQVVPQHPQQRRIGFGIDGFGLAIHGQRDQGSSGFRGEGRGKNERALSAFPTPRPSSLRYAAADRLPRSVTSSSATVG